MRYSSHPAGCRANRGTKVRYSGHSAGCRANRGTKVRYSSHSAGCQANRGTKVRYSGTINGLPDTSYTRLRKIIVSYTIKKAQPPVKDDRASVTSGFDIMPDWPHAACGENAETAGHVRRQIVRKPRSPGRRMRYRRPTIGTSLRDVSADRSQPGQR